MSENDLNQELSRLPGWSVEGGELVRTFTFQDFAQAMEFVNQVAEAAEAARHHPDIDIRYNKVRLGLVTHDSGGITTNDTSMARTLSGLAG